MSTPQCSVVDGLMNPDAYPHPCTNVELVETHISWVLLTGLRAYKIKKPVDLGFVNFTTLARRRHFCEEEFRTNRRLAPELYLDVVPITGTAEHPQVGGDGPVIDYAVCMLQFDQRRLLSHLPLSELSAAHIDNLADQCAAFHTAAAVPEPNSAFGSPDQIMLQVRDNFDVLQNLDHSIRESVETLQERTELEFTRLHPCIEERKRNGMIRECHGDLHLGNMFLQNDHVTIFDGIEFSEELRWIDVVSDIAFVVMDLNDRGCPGIANRFLNRWLERTGDYVGLQVLPFYCAYRAAVRAKIDAIRIRQPDVSQSDQRHLANDCRGYLELAREYTLHSRRALLITTGPSGSGKTTTTQKLVESIGLIRVRSDVERKRLFGLTLEGSSPSELKSRIYSAETTAATYDRLADLATQVISAGFPAVVDATFLRRADRGKFSRLADDLGVPFLIITCNAGEQQLRARILHRRNQGRDASEADVKVLEAQLTNVEPLSSFERQRAVENTDEHLAATVEARIGMG